MSSFWQTFCHWLHWKLSKLTTLSAASDNLIKITVFLFQWISITNAYSLWLNPCDHMTSQSPVIADLQLPKSDSLVREQQQSIINVRDSAAIQSTELYRLHWNVFQFNCIWIHACNAKVCKIARFSAMMLSIVLDKWLFVSSEEGFPLFTSLMFWEITENANEYTPCIVKKIQPIMGEQLDLLYGQNIKSVFVFSGSDFNNLSHFKIEERH